LGRAAIQQGYSVLFATATALVTGLANAHREGRLDDRLSHWAKPKLLIVDELGYLPLEPSAAHLFFHLVSRRYERGSRSPAIAAWANGIRCSATRWWPRPSWIASCTTATCV